MTYVGHVEKGVVVFDGPQRPPEGTVVRIEEVKANDKQNWGEVFKDLIGSVEGLPPDMAENHDHHIHGAPEALSERFADSFVFLAMLNRQDRRHAAAVQALSSSSEPLVTTAWVLTELADGLCAANSRGAFVTLEQRLRQNPRVTIVGPDEILYDAALELYRQRGDKDWSLTDCVSFVVMQQRGIREALTGDKHFEQAGFVALLR